MHGQENWERNTDLIEMMEVKHVMSQAAQDLNDGETRHESREAEAREHEGAVDQAHINERLASSTARPHESRRCAWRMRVCMMFTSQVHYHQHSTTTKGWRSAPDAILPGHRRAPHWGPDKDTHGALAHEQQ